MPHLCICQKPCGLAGVAEAVDVALRKSLAPMSVPAIETGGIHLSIGRIHTRAVDAGQGIMFKAHDGGLIEPFHFLQHHVIEPALTETGVEQPPRKRTPARVIHPELAA